MWGRLTLQQTVGFRANNSDGNLSEFSQKWEFPVTLQRKEYRNGHSRKSAVRRNLPTQILDGILWEPSLGNGFHSMMVTEVPEDLTEVATGYYFRFRFWVPDVRELELEPVSDRFSFSFP